MKSDYKQNITFPILLLVFSVLIFFSADNSIGAVGLRQVYGRSGMFAAIVIAMLGLIMQGLWHKINWLTTIELCFYFMFVVAGLWYMASMPTGILHSIAWLIITPMSLTSYFLSFAYVSLMPRIFIMCLFLTSAFYFFSAARKRTLPHDDLYWIAMIIVVHAAMYLMAISYRDIVNPYQFYDTAYIENHTYYLQGELGGYRDEDDLFLYECNSVGISCEVIFHEEILQIQGKYPHLIAEQDTIKVFLDSETGLFTHSPER